MSIASEITRLNNAKNALKTSINAVTDAEHKITNETLDEYSDFFEYISHGGSSQEYTELPYIQSTGTQYIDTEIKVNGNLRCECVFLNLNPNNQQNIFGGREGPNTNTYTILYNASGNNIRSDYDTIANQAVTINNSRNMFYIDKNKNVTTIKNLYNNSSNTLMTNYNNFTSNNNLYIFCRNQNGTAQELTSICLFYFKIYDNDVLVRDFIPIKRNSDDVICLYDKVSKTYFENKGTGNFLTLS